jgi:hypothetical protein
VQYCKHSGCKCKHCISERVAAIDCDRCRTYKERQAAVSNTMRTAVCALICSHAAADATQLLTWAQSQGATVSPRLVIRRTTYGGNGLFVSEAVAKGTPLVRIPGDLQLGVEVLAKSDAADLQRFVKGLPWQEVVAAGLGFLPCAAAICAEKRNAESRFAPYLQFLDEVAYTNAIASCDTDDCPSLAACDAVAAEKVKKMRYGLRAAANANAIDLDELCWAAAVVCSRSLRRRIAPPLSPEAVDNVGPVAATDRSRLLPVIDLVNHGGDKANAAVQPLKNDPEDHFATCLVAARDLAEGEEILIDYGAGSPPAGRAEAFLLDYGFVLPGAGAYGFAALEGDFLPAVGQFSADRAGMRDVAAEELDRLKARIQRLVAAASAAHKGKPLAFSHEGEPTPETLSLALALSCRGPEDVARVCDGAAPDAAHVDLARQALRAAAAAALARADAAPRSEPLTPFDEAAAAYAEAVREALRRAT